MRSAFFLLALFTNLSYGAADPIQDTYLSEVKSLLPPVINALFSKTELKFGPMKGNDLKTFSCSEGTKKDGEIFGFTRKIRGGRYLVTINEDVLHLFKNNRPLPNCPHDSSRKLAVATLVHEMGHVYEFENKSTSNTEFKKAFSFILRDVPHKRSPDIYESTDAREAFTVNLEHFILDDTYKCRRPTLQRYFGQTFGLPQEDSSSCSRSKVRVGDLSSEVFQLKDIDPSRVYQIHFLLAGSGKQIVSKWGHAMIRVVLCSPKRTSVNEDCLKDITNHVVLSFRGNTNGQSMNSIAGLTGKYPSQLFLLSMSDIITDYNFGEDREIFSVPLRLNERQKRNVLNAAQEIYWGYSGRYKFISNNCANETLQILQSSLFDEDVAKVSDGLFTPHEVLRNLEHLNLVETSRLEELRKKDLGTYYFPPIYGQAQKALDDLIERSLLDSKTTLKTLVKNPQELRSDEILHQDRKALLSLYALTDHISKKNILVNSKNISKVLAQEMKNDAPRFANMALQLDKFNPSQVAGKNGYGIALDGEALREEDQAQMFVDLQTKKAEVIRDLSYIGKMVDTHPIQIINDSQILKKKILTQLKQL